MQCLSVNSHRGFSSTNTVQRYYCHAHIPAKPHQTHVTVLETAVTKAVEESRWTKPLHTILVLELQPAQTTLL
jgi:hypothetical protein